MKSNLAVLSSDNKTIQFIKNNNLEDLCNLYANSSRNTDDAKLARQHNNANILVLPGRQIDVDEAKNCFKIFINTSFDGGRHQKRVEKID